MIKLIEVCTFQVNLSPTLTRTCINIRMLLSSAGADPGGGCRGCAPLPSQLRHSLVVHTLIRNILDPPLFCTLRMVKRSLDSFDCKTYFKFEYYTNKACILEISIPSIYSKQRIPNVLNCFPIEGFLAHQPS